jgi:hypothetical protein
MQKSLKMQGSDKPAEASVKVRKGIEKAMGLPEDNCGNRESKEINPCAETAIRRT